MICSMSLKGQQNYLVIGDSHGAAKDGWVYHLAKLRTNDNFCNLSISGNTIGFKNLGRDTLNTLYNIQSYIRRGKNELGRIDKILIMLGTNDCKSSFKDSLSISTYSFERILKITKQEFDESTQVEIIFITPPPFDSEGELSDKYSGANKRLRILIPKLLEIAKNKKIKQIDLNKFLGKKARHNIIDGVHYNSEGYMHIAKIINDHL